MSAGKCWMVVVAMFGLIARVEAATANLQFSGTLTTVPSSLSSQFTPGQAFTGNYVFDLTGTDIAAEPLVGRYATNVSQFNLSIGGYELTAAVPGDLEVTDAASDGYIVTTIANGNAIQGITPLLESIQLSDSTGTAFSSVDIPGFVDITKFDVRDLTIDFTNGARVIGRIETIAVPEPVMTGWLMVLLGLAPRWARRIR